LPSKLGLTCCGGPPVIASRDNDQAEATAVCTADPLHRAGIDSKTPCSDLADAFTGLLASLWDGLPSRAQRRRHFVGRCAGDDHHVALAGLDRRAKPKRSTSSAACHLHHLDGAARQSELNPHERAHTCPRGGVTIVVTHQRDRNAQTDANDVA
jgi:hypothetical protein